MSSAQSRQSNGLTIPVRCMCNAVEIQSNKKIKSPSPCRRQKHTSHRAPEHRSKSSPSLPDHPKIIVDTTAQCCLDQPNSPRRAAAAVQWRARPRGQLPGAAARTWPHCCSWPHSAGQATVRPQTEAAHRCQHPPLLQVPGHASSLDILQGPPAVPTQLLRPPQSQRGPTHAPCCY
eukprot:1158943-Pelagomonas_calceolata.AAC.12